jgi:hypothetical protein
MFRSKLTLHRDAVARDIRRPLTVLIAEKAPALTGAFLRPRVRGFDCCGCGRDRHRGVVSAARSSPLKRIRDQPRRRRSHNCQQRG